MDSYSRFTAPQQSEISASRLHLHTPTIPGAVDIPSRRFSRPEPLRIVSTPPDSPTRIRANTMGTKDTRMPLDSGVITPPATPTRTSYFKAESTSSMGSLLELRRGGSITSTSSTSRRKLSIKESELPGSTALKVFDYSVSDYEITNKKKPLGSGLWSDVYLAEPSLQNLSSVSAASSSSVEIGAELTPPITPVKSRTSSLSKGQLPEIPEKYAIKTPASKSAKQVLGEEAKILSYLSRFPDAAEYVVPFYGQDMRTAALVLKAMDTTLENWIHANLNRLSESERSEKLAKVFPELALSLLNGLQWIQNHGCTHSDIKPSNVLLSPSSSSPASSPNAVYSDFSSATLSVLTTDADAKPAAPLGGGTWDFLDPSLVTKTSIPISPSSQTDLWSLAITLLHLIIGDSPFECAGSNVFQRREMVKQGNPLAYATYGDSGPRNLARIKGLSKMLGWDVGKWFGKVLCKSVEKRVDVVAWTQDLENGIFKGATMMKI